MKCPDCKTKVDPARNGDWRCWRCFAGGVTLTTGKRRTAHVLERHLTISGEPIVVKVGPKENLVSKIVGRTSLYRLNEHHPGSSFLTKLRKRVSS